MSFRALATRFKHYDAAPVKEKPPSDRTVLMANPDGSVSYFREGADGEAEPVAVQDVVRMHLKRRKALRDDGRLPELPSWRERS